MAGTKIGGLKAVQTNKERYGEGFYAKIGAKGGRNGHKGGFASNPELARIAGAKGGKISVRGKTNQTRLRIQANHDVIVKMYNEYVPVAKIAKAIEVPTHALYKYIREEVRDYNV